MAIVIVASNNPVKVNSARQAFEQMFPEAQHEVIGSEAPSGVADQPFGNDEIIRGARNRARYIRESSPEADYWVGIEGGLTHDEDNRYVALAWIVIIDKQGKESKSSTGTFVLPEIMAELIREGLEMGAATDKLHGFINSKQKGGTVGVLTEGLIDRTAYYTHAAILALIPFKNSRLY